MFFNFHKLCYIKPFCKRPYLTSSSPETLVAMYARHGQPEKVIKLEKQLLELPGPNQVVIKMLYAPINPSDINIIEGTYPIQQNLPSVGGNEGVGQVVQIGDCIKKLKLNDFVIPANSGLGTWRTYLVANEDQLIPVDSTIDPECLACLAINPCTALCLLNDFVPLKANDVVIQNGANSMVGLSLVQLAASRGIKTINIIRDRPDPANIIEKIKACGGHIVETDTRLNTSEFKRLISDLPKPKIAFNCIGGPIVAEMARLLADEGTIVTYGAMSRKPISIPSSLLIFKRLKLEGFWLSKWIERHSTQEKEEMYTQIVQAFKEKKIQVWTEHHTFAQEFFKAMERAQTSYREKKVMLKF